MSDIPSTVSYIGYHAATAPAQIAIVESGRQVTYRDFYRDIRKMTGALREVGVTAGETVAVEITGFYRHWVILLACEALGAGTMSYNQSETAALGDRFAALDRVICSTDAAPDGAKQVLVADHDWLTAVGQRPLEEMPPSIAIDPDAPVRIIKSFGTTGVLQLMVHTGRVHDYWLRQFRFRTNMDNRSRYLLTAGFGIQAFHVHATSCIRMGGTCICGNPNEIATDIERYRITHATFLPAQLEQLLRGHGALPLEPRLRQIFTIGAPAAKSIRDRTRQILAEEISESYGTNETGGVSNVDEGGVGTVFPGVEVQVLDDHGNPVFGAKGEIRLRSAGVVQGYLDDPATTAQMFRDGWFYPGDIGQLYDPHRLSLAGRVEDYLTISGVKHSLDVLEKALLDALPARDICLLAGGKGAEAAVTMLVLTDSPADAEKIRQGAPAIIPKGIDRLTVVEARNIPRDTDGRVQRAKLGWQLRQVLKDRAAR